MSSVQVRVGEYAYCPCGSIAPLCAWHEIRCCPAPDTGICALLAFCHCVGPESSEQPIATPLGPAVADAVTYCVPAVVDAWVGPDRVSWTGSLSTCRVSE